MPADQLALAVGEERAVLLVGQHGEKRLHMRNLAAKAIRHTHGVRRVSLDQRGTLVRLGHHVIDEHAAVDEIDLLVLCYQRFAVPLQLARIGNERGDAHFLEALLEDFELGDGRHVFPVYDGNLRLGGGSSPVQVAHHQSVEELGAERVRVNFIPLRKLIHHHELAEDLRKRFRVACTRRRFAVVFRKFERVGKQKRIQARGRAGPPVSRGNPSKTFLFLPQMELRKEILVFERCAGDALAEIRDGLRHGSHALFVFRGKKKRAQKRTMNAIAKGKLGSAHALEQIVRERRQTHKRSFQNGVPLLNGRPRQDPRCWSAGHAITIPLRTPPERPQTSARRRRSLALP